MTDKELSKFGEWLNTKGYDIDLKDDFWMEDYRWNEHKTRDVIDLIKMYHTEQLFLSSVVVPKGTLPYPYKHQLKSIDQLNQAQASLSQQLQILRNFANKLGLYDASDYLK